MSKHDLKVDWATHAAAVYACKHWHYSKSTPCGKLVRIGVWEYGRFIGVVIFGSGSNRNMLKSYGLTQDGGCELVRVALSRHETPVSRVVSIAIRFLKKKSPKMRLIVSYADPEEGHHGGVYQAGNWVYRGISSRSIKIWYKGKWSHKKTVDDAGVEQSNLKKKVVQGKHTYLMPLDKDMRNKIAHLAKPYPKSARSETSDTPSSQLGKGGAAPTLALHLTQSSTNA